MQADLPGRDGRLLQPGLIWGAFSAGGEVHVVEHFDALPTDGFRWLHLNLADQRTHDWLSSHAALDPTLLDVLVTRDEQPRIWVAPQMLGLILQDFQRDFENSAWDGIGALHVGTTPHMLITARYHPVQSADLIRQRLMKSFSPGAAPALTVLLHSMTGTFAAMARALEVEVQTAEDEFLNFDPSPITPALISVRRRAARLHRIVAGLRMVLHRLEHDPDTPEDIHAVAEQFSQRANAVDVDILAAQAHLRVLRDEFDLQATQRTNDNPYFLSVISALLLPATLITGFFGMNTGGLPFAHNGVGTAIAAVIAFLASWLTWKLLRRRT